MESVLLSLALLACPVGMVAMMWFMMRWQNKQQTPDGPADLRAEQARLTQEIDDLERRKLTEPVGGRR
jgi:hypothetical protein